MSNKGKWDSFYSNLTEREPYIDSPSYAVGAHWLSDCSIVEDWGCGKGWFASTVESLSLPFEVVSIDGSQSPFADKIEDLVTYTSTVDGIFMRSVAEHNFDWFEILDNLTDSFKKKAFVQFYTPMNYDSDEPLFIQFSPGYPDVPEISIPASVWHSMLDGKSITWRTETVDSDLAYGVEYFYYLAR